MRCRKKFFLFFSVWLFGAGILPVWSNPPAYSHSHQTGTETPEMLKPGQTIQKETKGGTSFTFLIAVQAGDGVSILVEQKGMDLGLSWVDPDGKILTERDSPNGAWGNEELHWMADQPGTYQIKLRAFQSLPVPAKFSIVVKLESGDLIRSKMERETAFEQGKRTRSVKQLEATAQLSRMAHDDLMEGFCWKKIGDLQTAEGDFKEGLKCFLKAIEKEDQAGDHLSSLQAWREVAKTRETLGDLAQSVQILENVHQEYFRLGDRYREALILNEIGRLKEQRGESLAAIEYGQQALKLLEELDTPATEALLLSGLGRIWGKLGDFRTGVNFQEQAVQKATQSGDVSILITVLLNQSIQLTLMGDTDGALAILNEQLLPLTRRHRQTTSEARTLNAIGYIWYLKKSFAKASNYFALAQKVLTDPKEIKIANLIQHNLIGISGFLGNPRQTIERLEKEVLPVQERLGLKTDQCSVLLLLGKFHLALGEFEKAEQRFTQAQELAQTLGKRAESAEVYWCLADCSLKKGDLPTAENHCRKALSLVETLRETAGLEIRVGFFATAQDYYNLLIDILMKKHSASPTSGFDREAFSINERRLARGLIDELTALKPPVSAPAKEESSLIQLRNLEIKIREKSAYRASLMARSNASESERETVERELSALIREQDRLNQRFSQVIPSKFSGADVETLQKNLLDSETALVEYAPGRETYYAWVVSSKGFTSHVLASKETLETAVRKLEATIPDQTKPETLKSTVAQRRATFQQTSVELSRILWAPLNLDSTIKRIVLVRPDLTALVPFAGLPLSPEPTKPVPLVSRYELITIPSGTFILEKNRHLPKKSQDKNPIAVIADPVFRDDDLRLSKQAQLKAQNGTPLAIASTVKRGTVLDRLPSSEVEAETISTIWPGKVVKKTGFEATRQNVLGADWSQFQILHFATHGIDSRNNPKLSCLVLSLLDSSGNAQDGFLTQSDISNLNLDARLVVLNSCRTARGTLVPGEGSLSLHRAFLLAGARCVAATLWDVEDTSALAMTKQFYVQLLKQGQTPASALRQTQLYLLNSKQWNAPEYWAAYEIYGDWRSFSDH